MSFPIQREPPWNFCPVDEEIADDTHWWVIGDTHPFLHYSLPLTPTAMSHLQQTAMKLYLEGFHIFDEDNTFPNFDDANGWLGNIRVHYPDFPSTYHGYPNPSYFGMFDLGNLDGIPQFDPSGRPDNPTFPFNRSYSGSSADFTRDFPSPWDFTNVYFSMLQRVWFRTKRCLQASRLARFGHHGGRPRKH